VLYGAFLSFGISQAQEVFWLLFQIAGGPAYLVQVSLEKGTPNGTRQILWQLQF